jgi:hypothetical protein
MAAPAVVTKDFFDRTARNMMILLCSCCRWRRRSLDDKDDVRNSRELPGIGSKQVVHQAIAIQGEDRKLQGKELRRESKIIVRDTIEIRKQAKMMWDVEVRREKRIFVIFFVCVLWVIVFVRD